MSWSNYCFLALWPSLAARNVTWSQGLFPKKLGAPSNFLGRSPVAMWTSLLRINTPTRRHVHSILNKIRCKRRKKKPTSTTYFTCAIFPGISCNFLIHFFFRAGILQKIMGEKSVATPKSENCSGSSQRGFSQSLSRVNSHWRRLVNEHKKLERWRQLMLSASYSSASWEYLR